jgi:hypothetical protein
MLVLSLPFLIVTVPLVVPGPVTGTEPKQSRRPGTNGGPGRTSVKYLAEERLVRHHKLTHVTCHFPAASEGRLRIAREKK